MEYVEGPPLVQQASDGSCSAMPEALARRVFRDAFQVSSDSFECLSETDPLTKLSGQGLNNHACQDTDLYRFLSALSSVSSFDHKLSVLYSQIKCLSVRKEEYIRAHNKILAHICCVT